MLDLKLEQNAKSVAIVLGISYGSGIVISNSYLAGLGVMDFDLLRPQAILTGLWFIWFVAVAIVAEDSIQRAFRMKGIPASWRLGNALIAFCGAGLFYFVAILLAQLWYTYSLAQIATLQPAGPRFPGIIWRPFIMFLSAASVLTEGQNAVKEWKRRTSDEKLGPTSAAFFLGHCTWLLASLTLFTYLFVTSFYRYIPQQYGGGRPRPVQIAVSDKAAQVLNELSIATNKSVIQGSVELIHETSQALALRVNGATTLTVSRQDILAIRFK